jgi:hypothetical protein
MSVLSLIHWQARHLLSIAAVCGICQSERMQLLRHLSLAFCLIYLCPFLHSQYLHVGISGAIPVDNLKKMDDDLLIADPAPKLDLLKRLGIDSNIAEAATSPRFSHDIQIEPLRTQSGKLYGILSLPCGIQNLAFIYLLDKTGTSIWHAVDHVSLDCFHGTPTHRLLSPSPGEDFIFVEHVSSGHGSTGELDDQATLYSVSNGKMHQVLSTNDYSRRQEPTWTLPPVEQNSSFLQLPGGIIEETRITSQKDSLLRAERRIWGWANDLKAFQATSFHTLRDGSEAEK